MDCTGIIVGPSPSENVIISNCDKPSQIESESKTTTSKANERYKDSTGYQPKWAKPQTEKETLDFCYTVMRTADSASIDFKWCKEFTSYYNKKFNIPESKTIVTQPVNRQPTVAIYGGIETVHQNQYLVVVQICAGSDRFESPNIYLTSDLVTKKPIVVYSVLGANSCTLVDYSIKANDPLSIGVGFSDTNELDSSKLTELEKEIAELKKLIVEKGLDKPSEKTSTDAAAEKKAADKKAADKKAADKKAADKKAADKKAADKKAADKKAADKKAADKKASEAK